MSVTPLDRHPASAATARASHAAAAATIAAPTDGRRLLLKRIVAGFTGTAGTAAGTLTITSNGVTIYQEDISQLVTVTREFADGIPAVAGNSIVATLADGGVGIVGFVNVAAVVES